MSELSILHEDHSELKEMFIFWPSRKRALHYKWDQRNQEFSEVLGMEWYMSIPQFCRRVDYKSKSEQRGTYQRVAM